MKKKFSALLVLVLTCGISTQAFAWKTVYDPKNHAANLETKVQMIKQVIQSAEQIRYQLQDLKSLDYKDLDKVESQCNRLFSNIQSIRKESDAIGEDWTKTYQQWNEMNPDYNSFQKLSQFEKQNSAQQSRWAKTLEQALTMCGITSKQEQDKTAENVLQAIKASNNAQGTVQAIQAASQLTGIQIAELQRQQALFSELLRMEAHKQQIELDKAKQVEKMSQIFTGDLDKLKNTDVTIKNQGKDISDFRSH